MKTGKTVILMAGAVFAALGASTLGTTKNTFLSSFTQTAEAAKEKPSLTNPRKIGWDDLLPDGENAFIPPDASSDFPDQQASPFPNSLPTDHLGLGKPGGNQQALFQNDTFGSETGMGQDPSLNFTPRPIASARADLANQPVKLAGYMTPLNVEKGKTRMFLLVPYVGACIHVPAPPANQIVLVETSEPIEVREMWEPFEAIGTLRVESIATELADVSYTMELDRIEPYVDDLEDNADSDTITQ